MPGGFDGSGNFLREMNWTADAAAGIKILASRHDTEDENFRRGLSLVLCRDGQGGPTADINWNGKKITNLAHPTNPTDACTRQYVDGIRTFGSAINITGSTPESQVRFTGSTGPWGDSYVTANCAFGASADGLQWIWNDSSAFTGNNIMTLAKSGTLTVKSAGGYAVLALDKAAGATASTITGQKAAKTRWSLHLGDEIAEAGANAGSNCTINRHADDGAFLGTALSISRADGAASFSGNLSVGGNATVTGLVQSNASIFQSVGATVILATVGAGTVWLRPNGNASVAGQAYINNGGDLNTASNIFAAGGHFVSGTNSAILGPTTPGAVYLRPNGYSNSTGQIICDINGTITAAGQFHSSGSQFNSNINVCSLSAAGGTVYLRPNGANNTAGQAYVNTGGEFFSAGDLVSNSSTIRTPTTTCILSTVSAGSIYFRPNGPGSAVEQATYAAGGNLTIGNQGFKAVAGDWAAASDERIKTVTGDYTTGLDAVRALNVRTFIFKGNDVTRQPTEEDEAEPVSPHARLAEEGTECIGLVAQEAEIVMPDLVTQVSAYIDNQPVSDFRVLDTTNITYALVNAVKELATRVEALEAA